MVYHCHGGDELLTSPQINLLKSKIWKEIHSFGSAKFQDMKMQRRLVVPDHLGSSV
jgi:hypothetical protein